jgi:hypothetical protein
MLGEFKKKSLVGSWLETVNYQVLATDRTTVLASGFVSKEGERIRVEPEPTPTPTPQP